MSRLILLGGRGFQILCAAVVLGLSVNVYNSIDKLHEACDYYKLNCDLKGLGPSVGYTAFVGAWALLSAFLGIAAAFVDAIKFVIISAVDSFAMVAFLAGGIRLAVWLGAGFGGQLCPSGAGDKACTQLKADAAFLLLGFLVTMALLIFGFVRQRGGKSATGV